MPTTCCICSACTRQGRARADVLSAQGYGLWAAPPTTACARRRSTSSAISTCAMSWSPTGTPQADLDQRGGLESRPRRSSHRRPGTLRAGDGGAGRCLGTAGLRARQRRMALDWHDRLVVLQARRRLRARPKLVLLPAGRAGLHAHAHLRVAQGNHDRRGAAGARRGAARAGRARSDHPRAGRRRDAHFPRARHGGLPVPRGAARGARSDVSRSDDAEQTLALAPGDRAAPH